MVEIYEVRRSDGISMIYISSFMKIGWDIQKLVGGGYKETDSAEIT
jgi:hypothetical protein